MLHQVFKVSLGTCQQFAEDAVKISNIWLSQGMCNILQVRWKCLWCIQRKFSYKSIG